jgi:D-lactate dehydrogenase (cytochrome)
MRPAAPPPDVLAALLGRLGPGSVLTEATDVAAHVVPWRGPRGDASAVVLPSDTEQVRTVLSWAREHRVRLVPQGANTGLVGASTPPPHSSAVVLSTARLRHRLEIDATDRTAVVDAGVRLSELNAAAAHHRLHLPIDLGADPSLGGMVATNTGGARMLRHGDLRRSLLGVRAVLADADCSVVDELSTLRKHNVGPSIGQLLVGSGGGLGVVTTVAVELTPMADDRACAWLVPTDDASIISALERLEADHHDDLSAFEVVAAEALDAALSLRSITNRPFGDRRSPAHSVLVEFEGAAGAEERLVAALAALDDDGLLVDAVVQPPEPAWSVRHAITEGLAHRGTVVGFDVSVPRPRLPELVAAVRTAAARELPRAVVADFGHWGDGGVHCNLCFPHVDGVSAPPSAQERSTARELVLGLVVDRFDGSFSAEHGVGPANADWWRRCTPAGTARILAQWAQVADPLGILGHPDLPYRVVERSSSPSSAAGNGAENR